MTTTWISAPRRRQISGTAMKPIQKFPVASSEAQASTVPTMKKSPCAMLMMSRRPKMTERPSAMSAMMRPHTRP